MEKEKVLLTTKQLEAALQISPATVVRWRNEGMPYKAFGKKTFRYNLDEVLNWRATNK